MGAARRSRRKSEVDAELEYSRGKGRCSRELGDLFRAKNMADFIHLLDHRSGVSYITYILALIIA